jgi:hypothetical protein
MTWRRWEVTATNLIDDRDNTTTDGITGKGEAWYLGF